MSRRFKWLIALVVLVCAGWTAVWFFAARFAGATADRWIASQALNGRTWTCADRQIGGFPFRMLVTCKSLQFSGKTRGGGAIKLTSGPVRAIAQVYNPKLILAEVDGPLTLSLPGKVRTVAANWSNLNISLRAAKPLPERFSLVVAGLKMQVDSATGDSDNITAKSAELHLRPAPDVTADIGAADIALVVNTLTSQLANQLSGDPSPVNASLLTRVTRTPSLLLRGRGPERLERWRLAQGNATVQNSAISKGPLQLVANGRLALDDGRRLSGKIDACAAGLGLVTRRLGLPDFLSTAGNLIGGLFGRSKCPEPAPGAETKNLIPVPVTMKDGMVRVGGFPLRQRLKPLY